MKRKPVPCRRSRYFFICEVLSVADAGLNSAFIKTNGALILVSTWAWKILETPFSPFTENPGNVLWCFVFSGLFWWLLLLKWEVISEELQLRDITALCWWFSTALAWGTAAPTQTEGQRVLRGNQVTFMCLSSGPVDQPGNQQNKHLRLTCALILATPSSQ